MTKPELHEWLGAYDPSWTGIITPESFSHPAKFARGLIERIFDYCIERGYLQKGDRVGDPFGGIGTGGICAAYRGLHWIGCELEPRFVAMANKNFALHRHGWSQTGKGTATIIQGDSRQFAENVAGVVTSPPYGEAEMGAKGEGPGAAGNAAQRSRIANGSEKENAAKAIGHGYGNGNGQIGSLKSGQVDSVISSPPYNLPMSQDHNGSKGGTRGTTSIEPGAFAKYGNEPGQIEGVKQGNVDSVITSPPYAGISPEKNGTGPDLQKQYETYRSSGGGSSFEKFVITQRKHSEGYGKSNGQISTLKEGTVQAVVSSPPYSDIAAGAGGLNTKPAKKPGQQPGRNGDSASQNTDQRYGTSIGQISQLKGGSVEGVVSSPPYEGTILSGGGGIANECRSTYDANENYGASQGQIGKESGETYWQAVDAVYRSCFQAIKPGGVIVLVVKDYCAKGKRVRLCDDTMRLLEHIGFQPLERIHAMLVTETKHNDLFDGETTTKKQRKSFFRRLYEAKLPEDDDRRIDYEEVLIARRPQINSIDTVGGISPDT